MRSEQRRELLAMLNSFLKEDKDKPDNDLLDAMREKARNDEHLRKDTKEFLSGRDTSAQIRWIGENRRRLGFRRPSPGGKPQSRGSYGIWTGEEELSTDFLRTIKASSLARVQDELEKCRVADSPVAYLPLDCRTLFKQESASESIDAVLDRWVSSGESNFAIVLAPFGSGKSLALAKFAERLLSTGSDEGRRIPIVLEYREIASTAEDRPAFLRLVYSRALQVSQDAVPGSVSYQSHLKRFVFIIDAYDEAFGQGSPHLRQLAPLISGDSKVLVACRRSPEAVDDELIKQLNDPARTRAFGLKQPLVVQLQPLSLPTLEQELSRVGDGRGRAVIDYLSSPRFAGADYLFRPLVLQMLLAIDVTKLDPSRVASVGDLYQRFAEVILSKDLDNGGSGIPSGLKEEILTNLASDIFASPEPDESPAEGVTPERVQLRVMETVSKPWAPTAAEVRQREWVRDFLTTNHLLVSRGSGATKRFAFVHHTFYEFFLAKYFLARIGKAESLGLQESHTGTGGAIFDSLVMYFLRFGASKDLPSKLVALARRESLSNPDRLMVIFLLEDHPKIGSVLRECSKEYTQFLLTQEELASSLFLRKVIDYQLILASNDVGRAFTYVEMIRKVERGPDTELERHTFTAGGTPSDFLLSRLLNPELAAAKPISVFRLGQFGDERALIALRGEMKRATPKMRPLVVEAIKSIEARIKPSHGESRKRKRE